MNERPIHLGLGPRGDAVLCRCLVGALIVLFTAPESQAQTNTPFLPRKLFSCPVPRLVERPKQGPPRTETAAPILNAELQSQSQNDGADLYHWMNGQDLLDCPARSEHGGAFGWVERNVFEPETIQFKRVSISGSLVTAIKRKNPLCLLTSLEFLSIDW